MSVLFERIAASYVVIAPLKNAHAVDLRFLNTAVAVDVRRLVWIAVALAYHLSDE